MPNFLDGDIPPPGWDRGSLPEKFLLGFLSDSATEVFVALSTLIFADDERDPVASVGCGLLVSVGSGAGSASSIIPKVGKVLGLPPRS